MASIQAKSGGTQEPTQWGPTSISPMRLAQRTDAKLHGMEHTSVDYQYRFSLPIGHGTIGGLGEIKDQHTFRIEPPLPGAVEREGVTWSTRVASGGKMALHRTMVGTEGVIKPFSKASQLPSNVLKDWMRLNVVDLFSAIGTTGDPLQTLVRNAQTTPGFRVSASERTLMYRNIPVKQYRLKVDRTSAAEKKLGRMFFEIVIDSKYYLPITMENYQVTLAPKTNPKSKSDAASKPKRYFTTMYLTKWNQNAKTFPDHSFDLRFAHVETPKIR
jgi:hypothetical protein